MGRSVRQHQAEGEEGGRHIVRRTDGQIDSSCFGPVPGRGREARRPRPGHPAGTGRAPDSGGAGPALPAAVSVFSPCPWPPEKQTYSVFLFQVVGLLFISVKHFPFCQRGWLGRSPRDPSGAQILQRIVGRVPQKQTGGCPALFLSRDLHSWGRIPVAWGGVGKGVVSAPKRAELAEQGGCWAPRD